MNKSIFAIVGAFVLGAGGGFFIAKKMYESHYAQIAQEEIDSVKETFKNMAERPKTIRTSIEGGLAKKLDERKKLYDLTRQYSPGEETAKSFSKTVSTDDEDAEEEELEEPEEEPEDMDDDIPYLISESSYRLDDTQEKTTLVYYRNDDVLYNPVTGFVDDIDAVLGPKALDSLMSKSMVYVRDKYVGVDYAISAVSESYDGINSSPRERHIRNMKRRELATDE